MRYFDCAATTYTDKEVVNAMKPYFSKMFGNASTLYELGMDSKKALEKSRKIIAKLINANENEIIFTSGGTESDNTALKGVLFANRNKKHIITSKIEHHAILHSCRWLEKQGYEVTYINVDKNGVVNPKDVETAIRKDTALVSIMHANNEIGTLEPIEEIGNICKKKGVYFHTDAVQSFGKIHIDVKKMNIDLLSASSHKIYGPKGVGILYVRNGVKISPLLHGGSHENGIRSGTENIPGIVGFGKAVEIATKLMKKEMKRDSKLRDKMIKGLLQIPKSRLNGHPTKRLPGNVNVSFDAVEGESLILMLNERSIAASTGSACSTASLDPSHVLLAIGLKHEQAHGSLRFTIGRNITEKDVDYVLKVLPGIIKKLRAMSPVWKE